jgi:membrane-associated phospholipid phosphatase
VLEDFGQYLFRADARILLAMNHWLSQHHGLYKLALFATNRGTDIALVLTLAGLWFWPDPQKVVVSHEETLNNDKNKGKGGARRGPAVLRGPFGVAQRFTSRYVAPYLLDRPLLRDESRAQLIVFGAALITGYVITRLIGFEANVDRPFATYLHVREGEPGQYEALRRHGSFPSNHAVLLGTLAFFFYWNKTLGWVWAFLGALLIIIRAAVGFHSPLDMFTGACIGIIFVGTAMCIYRRGGKLYAGANMLARNFHLSNSPYCYYLYLFMGLIAIEVFVKHCDHLMEMIFSLRGAFMQKFGG